MDVLSNEERFFREREAHLRKQMLADTEAKAKAVAQREALTGHLAGNEALAQRLHDLGFDADTAPALHLLPLVEVAWADEKVTSREREAVLKVAAAHGIQPGSKAALLLTSTLETRPSQTVADQVFSVLHDLLAAKGLHPQSLVDACLEVASASGGFLGLGGKIGPEEEALIRSISSMVSKESQDRLVQKLE